MIFTNEKKKIKSGVTGEKKSLFRVLDSKMFFCVPVQTAIVQLEALALKEQYLGSQTRLYDLVEAVSDMCPEQSVMHLIQYR